MKQVQVIELFTLEDVGQVIVHLANFDWDFKSLGDLQLCFPSKSFQMKCNGCGEQQGSPVLTLLPTGNVRVSEIASFWIESSGNVYVQRGAEAGGGYRSFNR